MRGWAANRNLGLLGALTAVSLLVWLLTRHATFYWPGAISGGVLEVPVIFLVALLLPLAWSIALARAPRLVERRMSMIPRYLDLAGILLSVLILAAPVAFLTAETSATWSCALRNLIGGYGIILLGRSLTDSAWVGLIPLLWATLAGVLGQNLPARSWWAWPMVHHTGTTPSFIVAGALCIVGSWYYLHYRSSFPAYRC